MGTPVGVYLQEEGWKIPELASLCEDENFVTSYRMLNEWWLLASDNGLTSLFDFVSSSEKLQEECKQTFAISREEALILGWSHEEYDAHDLGCERVEPEVWFVPEDGLAATRALLQHIWREYPIVEHEFWDVEFLEDLVRLLEAAARHGIRFHLSVGG